MLKDGGRSPLDLETINVGILNSSFEEGQSERIFQHLLRKFDTVERQFNDIRYNNMYSWYNDQHSFAQQKL